MNVLQRVKKIEHIISQKSGTVIILMNRDLGVMTTIFRDVEHEYISRFAKLFDTDNKAVMILLNREYIDRYKEQEKFVLNHKDIKRILNEVANE